MSLNISELGYLELLDLYNQINVEFIRRQIVIIFLIFIIMILFLKNKRW